MDIHLEDRLNHLLFSLVLLHFFWPELVFFHMGIALGENKKKTKRDFYCTEIIAKCISAGKLSFWKHTEMLSKNWVQTHTLSLIYIHLAQEFANQTWLRNMLTYWGRLQAGAEVTLSSFIVCIFSVALLTLTELYQVDTIHSMVRHMA